MRAKTAPKPRWKDDQLLVCWAALVGDTYSIKKGEVLRGSDARVRLHPQCFVTADTPPSEWPPEVNWEALPEGPSETKILPGPSPDELCIALERVGHKGRIIERGQKVRRDDPAVVAAPHYFASLPIPLNQGG